MNRIKVVLDGDIIVMNIDNTKEWIMNVNHSDLPKDMEVICELRLSKTTAYKIAKKLIEFTKEKKHAVRKNRSIPRSRKSS